MSDTKKILLLFAGAILAVCFGVLLLLSLCVGIGCQTVEGPPGKDGRGIARMEWVPNLDGTEFRFILTDSSATGWAFVPAGEKGDPGASGIVEHTITVAPDTAAIHGILEAWLSTHKDSLTVHDTIKVILHDTIAVATNDTATIPANATVTGLMIQTPHDTISYGVFHNWKLTDGRDVELLHFQFYIVWFENGVKKSQKIWDSPALPKQSTPIWAVLDLSKVPLDTPVVVWVAAYREGWLHRSKWYVSSDYGVNVVRIVTPE
jgi:hypothetical protein